MAFTPITPHFIGSGNIDMPGSEPETDFLVTTDDFFLESRDNYFLIHD